MYPFPSFKSEAAKVRTGITNPFRNFNGEVINFCMDG